MNRIVKSKEREQFYIECPQELWEKVLKDVLRNDSFPWPMPVGHAMFKEPNLYNCIPINY